MSLILNFSIILKVKTVQTAEFRGHFTGELAGLMLKCFTQSGRALPPLCDTKTLVALEAASALPEYSQNPYIWITKDQKVIKSLQYFLPFPVQKIKNL